MRFYFIIFITLKTQSRSTLQAAFIHSLILDSLGTIWSSTSKEQISS